MASGLAVTDPNVEHSGDESEDDDDDVVEQSPCGRWEKRRQEVKLTYIITSLKLVCNVNIYFDNKCLFWSYFGWINLHERIHF